MNIGVKVLDAIKAPPVPPPVVGIRVKLKPKKLARGVARGVKKAGKGVAKVAKTAAAAAARLAAKPIAAAFKRLAMRRARLIAYRGRRTTVPTREEKVQGAKWALTKMAKAGPVGKLGVKILTLTKSATLGEEAVIVGLTGAEIAAAAAAIVAAIQQITSRLNKPGEAPADPHEEG